MEAAHAKPFEGLYGFIRNHLTFVNAVVLFATTVVSAIDFLLTPKFVGMVTIIYMATALLVVAMLAAAAFPVPMGKVLARVGIGMEQGDVPLWKRPAWRLCLLGLVGVSLAGFASVAHASRGGLIASSIPAARSLQESLLGLSRDVTDIKIGVDKVNAKLDRIADAVDPDNAADRCADLDCAIHGGASAKTIRKLFAKGATLPGNPVLDGAMLFAAATSKASDRLETLELLFSHGIDREMRLRPTLLDKGALTEQGMKTSREIFETARLIENPTMKFANHVGVKDLDTWNAAMGCLARKSDGHSVMELAVLQGDAELATHLARQGMKLPERPLQCQWKVAGHSGSAKVTIDAVSLQTSSVVAN